MKINITKKEYLKLLDILYIADWVMHAFTVGERTDTKEYRELEQKFFSYAKDFGFKDLVDPRDNYHSRKFEDETPAMDFIEEFQEETFWDELIERLAKRDFIDKNGIEALKKVWNDEHYFNELEELKDKYASEFDSNGIKELKIR